MKSSKRHPKISVIVPVYNAEKYLGYCLNSILSQTFPDLEAVLVNDGSTDGSLAICQQYEKADPRFKVISIPNGGVSNARNKAVENAAGDYFMFLDSDDVLALDALETMLAAEEKNHTGLVIGDTQLVDFSTKEKLPIRLSSDWTGEKALFTKDEFAKRKMELVWHTSMMEGLCGKLYDAKIWRECGARCPTGLNLGEDFIANMTYYDACNGVFFLKKTIYYYNNIQSSNSLTHKYRIDLFDNKMYLESKLLSHIGGFDALEPYQRDCYRNHIAMTGLRCIEDILAENERLSTKDKENAIRHILDNAEFKKRVSEAPYMESRFKPWVKLIADGDAAAFLGAPKPAQNQPKNRQCLPSRALGSVLRTMGSNLSKWRIGGVMLRYDESLRTIGLKATLHRYSRKERRKNALITEQKNITQSIVKSFYLNSQKQLNEARQEIRDTHNHIENQQQQLVTVKDELQRAYAEISQRQESLDMQINEKTENLSVQFKKSGEEIAETRLEIERQHNSLAMQLNDIWQDNKKTQDSIAEQVSFAQQSILSVRDDMGKRHDGLLEQISSVRDDMGKRQDGLLEQISIAQQDIFSVRDDMGKRQDDLLEQISIAQQGILSLRDDIGKRQDGLFEQMSTAQQSMQNVRTDIEKYQAALSADIASVRHDMQSAYEDILKHQEELGAKIQTSENDVKDMVYLSELRILKDTMRYRINELRQKKKILFIGTAEHSNIGDAAITLAGQYMLQRVFPDYLQVEFSTYEIKRNYSYIQAIIRPDDLIFLNGGGNLGSLYAEEEDLRRLIISDFPEHKIVILPQTVFFEDNAHGHEELEHSSRIYNAHRNLTICLRGAESLAFAEKYFNKAKCRLMPDLAFELKRNYAFDRNGILLCLRDDREGVYTEEQKSSIENTLKQIDSQVDLVGNLAENDISREERANVVNAQLKRFASHKLVVTDRLHGMIFSAVTHTPCITLNMGNPKLRDFIQTFFSDVDCITYLGGELEKLPDIARAMDDVKTYDWGFLDKDYFMDIRDFLRNNE